MTLLFNAVQYKSTKTTIIVRFMANLTFIYYDFRHSRKIILSINSHDTDFTFHTMFKDNIKTVIKNNQSYDQNKTVDLTVCSSLPNKLSKKSLHHSLTRMCC